MTDKTNTNAGDAGSSSDVSPIRIVQNVTDMVSEKITTQTQNFITKAKSSLSVLHKFTSEPEEEVDIQKSQEVNDEAKS